MPAARKGEYLCHAVIAAWLGVWHWSKAKPLIGPGVTGVAVAPLASWAVEPESSTVAAMATAAADVTTRLFRTEVRAVAVRRFRKGISVSRRGKSRGSLTP